MSWQLAGEALRWGYLATFAYLSWEMASNPGLAQRYWEVLVPRAGERASFWLLATSILWIAALWPAYLVLFLLRRRRRG